MPVPSGLNLHNKTAILYVSGGDHGPKLGQVLSEAGASVFVVARTQPILDDVLTYIDGDSTSGCVLASPVDSDVEKVMDIFDKTYQSADVLVNDARSFFTKPFTAITSDEWQQIQARNVQIPFLLSQQVASRMLKAKYGRIVNIVSVLAERGMINGSAFSITQAALLSLTRSLAVELGSRNIRVNAIGTGWFNSEDVPLEVQQEELLVRYTPLRRKGVPEDIGPLLVYLCSEVCDYATGQPIYIDGGLNAHP